VIDSVVKKESSEQQATQQKCGLHGLPPRQNPDRSIQRNRVRLGSGDYKSLPVLTTLYLALAAEAIKFKSTPEARSRI
jgi:hypothetical protein